MSKESGERLAFYMRVSSEEQAERMTIGTQEEFLEQYRGLYGHEVTGIYKDEAISGTVPLRERPGGRRLLEDATEGAFDVVLVYKLDRIGRTLLNVVDAHDRLHVCGVALRSATEPIDTSSPSGRLIFHMLASFAEFERGTIRERTQHGLHRAFRNGKQTGRIPYGYDIAEDGGFVLVDEEAAVVREVFSNIAGGSTLYREAQRLNGLGMPGPGWKYRGRQREHSARWTAATLSKLVNQTAYGGTHLVRISGGEGSVERECPPVVPVELQQQALARLAENKRHGRRHDDRSYLLSGLIRCAVCGSAFVGHPSGSPGKTRYYYICNDIRPQNQKKAARGHAPYVRAEWIEDLVWGDVKRFLENPGEVLERLRERAQADGKGEALAVRHADLTKRLGQKEAEKDRYVRLYAQGHLDDSELATYLEDLKYQTQNLRLLLESVEAEIAGKKEQQHLAETTGVWLHALRERTAEVEADTEEAQATRRELVRLLVEAVEVDRTGEGKTRLRITYRFGPPASPDRQNGGSQGERVHVVNNSLEYDDPLVPLVSVVAGLVVGEFLGIEETLKRLGDDLQKRFSRGESPVSRAFVTTSLLFCVGPLTVIGSLEDGLSGDYSLLALKSALDFVAALTFASVLGWGVLLSAGTVLFVQGSLTLGAAFLDAVVTDSMISATTATGAS
jgi:site-specific DNA recombinase